MSKGQLNNPAGPRNNFGFQISVLQLLSAIQTAIGAIPGVDYETRTTVYQATAGGPGYSIGDIIVRYDIIDVATSTIVSTIWFNQTTQTTIVAPAPANLAPVSGPTSITVNNGPGGAAVNIQDGGNSITIDNPNLDAPISALNLEATQLLIQALLTTIDADTSNLDVALSSRNAEVTQLLVKANTDNLDVLLSTRATEATLATRASEATLATMLTLAGFQARINTLGQKTMANSTPMVIASDQSSIPVTQATTVRTPSLLRAVAAGTVAAGARSVSVFNAGTTNGVWLGATIKPGEQFNYDAGGQGDTLGAFAYTASATAELVIATIV